VAIDRGEVKELRIGNLDGKRDWGFAGDYVDAMWRMLQQDKPDDYVIATGDTHTVRELIMVAFGHLGIDIFWEGGGEEEVGYDRDGHRLVSVDPDLIRPAEVRTLTGDARKAREELGWKPKVGFLDLVEMMVEADVKSCFDS
jgi:GDPmannose 4,6-dehydratase